MLPMRLRPAPRGDHNGVLCKSHWLSGGSESLTNVPLGPLPRPVNLLPDLHGAVLPLVPLLNLHDNRRRIHAWPLPPMLHLHSPDFDIALHPYVCHGNGKALPHQLAGVWVCTVHYYCQRQIRRVHWRRRCCSGQHGRAGSSRGSRCCRGSVNDVSLRLARRVLEACADCRC